MFPHERSLVEKLKDKPFALIGVNNDQDLEDAKEKNVKAKITGRSFYECKEAKISTEWNMSRWPTLYLIDHKGVIRQKYVGSPGNEVLDGEIDKLVKEAEKTTGG